jgi:hypothetical protein
VVVEITTVHLAREALKVEVRSDLPLNWNWSDWKEIVSDFIPKIVRTEGDQGGTTPGGQLSDLEDGISDAHRRRPIGKGRSSRWRGTMPRGDGVWRLSNGADATSDWLHCRTERMLKSAAARAMAFGV